MIRYHRSLNHKRCRFGGVVFVVMKLFARTTFVTSKSAAPPCAKAKCLGSGGSMIARLKLKGIDGRAPSGVEPAAQFDSTRGNLAGQDKVRIDRLNALS